MSSEAWDADIPLNIEQVKDCLKAQFPELLPFQEIICIGEGWDNRVFLVNQTFIFRFPRRKIAVALLEQENKLLMHLQSRVTLTIPNPRFIGQASQGFPYPFQAYAIIPGVSAEKANLNFQQRLASIKPLAIFLRQLHRINPAEASAMGASVPVFDRTHIQKTSLIFQERIKKIMELAIYQLNEAALISEIKLIQSLILPETERCLIHGDLYCRHLIFEHQRLSGVIDWGDVSISHKAVDLAVIWSFYPAVCHQEFLDLYGVVDPVTWQYARFLGLYTGVTLILYGHALTIFF
ncbi:MAG: hypothetical protein RLY40_1246 [Pseudomonadota bacterium]|jgi:aminoglycoside phosphotransferase (APT) family kinase protein